ncbi:amidohydrolase [Saccharopolyspora pogona]|uniref:amidohydrolase n=1 Tax=Saccharopolyspora pogona TaxID=333966 RepID=UPI00168A24A9|nr:amidohydrolase [Saccharopolyspora pogona]
MFDLIIRNANVITMDHRRPRARDVAIFGGRIAAIDADIPASAKAGHVIDARGETLLPGFHDAHNHMGWFGLSLDEVDLSGAAGLDDLYGRIERVVHDTPADGWVIGSGYDQNVLGSHPHRSVLDKIADGRLVWLKHRSGHMCVVNTPVLERLGLTHPDATDPAGGIIGRDVDGRPNGLLEEQAQNLVQALTLPYPVERLVHAIGAASDVYVAEGLTSVTEAGVGGGWIGKSPIEARAYHEAVLKNRLRVRTQLMVTSDVLHDLDHADRDVVDFGLDLGIATGFGDDRLALGAMKIFMDGSLVGHTAAMCSPYEHDTANVGYLQDDEHRLRTLISRAHRAGWQVAAHAIGDRAIDLTLDAFAQAQAAYPRLDARHRIEHCAVLSPGQLTRMARLGVIPVPQPQFVREFGDQMRLALGENRAAWAYRQRSFREAGIVVPGSSDRPVVQGAPLLGIQAMAERVTETGARFPGAEQIDVMEALRSYTVHSAYAGFNEDSRGSIAVGKLADLVQLAADPTVVDTSEIGVIPVSRTLIGGEVVFDATEAALADTLIASAS